MAKAKKQESKKQQDTSPAEEMEFNGKGLGVYFDKKLKRYVLASLDLSPSTDSAVITDRLVLGDSKLAVGLKASVALEQLMNKLK